MKRFLLNALLVAGLPLVTQAATISYNLTGGAGSGSIGNSLTFTSGGITVTATAWSANGGILEKAALGQYSAGLGVCNAGEGTNCGDPQHQVDNSGRLDFVLFQFSAPITPLTVTIDPYGTYDRDVTYYTFNAASNLNLTGVSLGSISGGPTDDFSTSSSSARNVSIASGGTVNSLLFGATTNAANLGDDYFKITGLKLDYTNPPTSAVPEPGTFVMLGGGLLLAGLARPKFLARFQKK